MRELNFDGSMVWCMCDPSEIVVLYRMVEVGIELTCSTAKICRNGCISEVSASSNSMACSVKGVAIICYLEGTRKKNEVRCKGKVKKGGNRCF